MALIYAIAIAVLTAYGVNLLWMAWCRARVDVRRPRPSTQTLDEWPEVTVQVPLYNEALVAERVIDACARLDYPNLEIQILDDSADETVAIAGARVAYWRRRDVDIVHVRRRNRDGFKAGALANGLGLARGSCVAIFDADFVPRRDFLRRTVPAFRDPDLGVVQARWSHLNADASLLTRIQAIGLDAHFAVEQYTRHATHCFLNFNGTAGLWRRACIDDAGGWSGDTIAEDLDLSYRAQLAGWQFRYVDDIEVPAELPSTMTGLRTQQFRWAKGSVETARKLLSTLWRADVALRRKVQGTIHLTAHVVFPFIVTAVLLHAPLVARQHAGAGPGSAYFGWMSGGLIGFTGFALAHVLAQRYLHADWPRRLLTLPAFMAGTIGLSISNTQAVVEALLGRQTPFIRTPKFGDRGGPAPRRTSRLRGIVLLEIAMLAYALFGAAWLVALEEWPAVPFQLLFVAGFGLVVAATIRDGAGAEAD